jgi:hypothetical protein
MSAARLPVTGPLARASRRALVALALAAQAWACQPQREPVAPPAGESPASGLPIDLDVYDHRGAELDEAELLVIVQLAERAGLRDIVELHSHWAPGTDNGDWVVVLERALVVEPTRVRQRSLLVRSTGSPVDAWEGEAPIVALGGWRTSGQGIAVAEYRRTLLKGRPVDVRVIGEVSFEEAQRVVAALCGGPLAGREAQDFPILRAETLDAIYRPLRENFFRAWGAPHDQPGHAPVEVNVEESVASGLDVELCVEGDVIVLLGWMTWQSTRPVGILRVRARR